MSCHQDKKNKRDVYRLYSTAAAAILKFHTIHPDKKLGRYTYLWRVILRISEFLKKRWEIYMMVKI